MFGRIQTSSRSCAARAASRTARSVGPSVHPNSTSLERHVKLGAPQFRKLAPYIDLREIEVFGQLSEAAADLVREKAAALGDGGRITLHEQSAGFGRLCVPPTV